MTRPTVHEGDNDNRDVRLLQQLLRDLNYDVGDIDGDFGPRTARAVTAYQTDHAIGDTPGECGPNTWAALEADAGATGGSVKREVCEYVSGGSADGRYILRRGSEEASEIRYLQELLTWRNFSPRQHRRRPRRKYGTGCEVIPSGERPRGRRRRRSRHVGGADSVTLELRDARTS